MSETKKKSLTTTRHQGNVGRKRRRWDVADVRRPRVAVSVPTQLQVRQSDQPILLQVVRQRPLGRHFVAGFMKRWFYLKFDFWRFRVVLFSRSLFPAFFENFKINQIIIVFCHFKCHVAQLFLNNLSPKTLIYISLVYIHISKIVTYSCQSCILTGSSVNAIISQKKE